MPSPKKKPDPADLLQLRIELRGIEPLIWRRVLVPGAISLARLHRIFQLVMGWTDSHLHEFQIGELRYGIPDPEFESQASLISERQARLDRCLGAEVREFEYLYDFGDGWEHRVVIEARPMPEPDFPYPLCVAGENACPPEDVGGIPGYQEFVAAIRDPSHEEHKSMLRWVGGAFDPAGFDLQVVNRRLRAGRL